MEVNRVAADRVVVGAGAQRPVRRELRDRVDTHRVGPPEVAERDAFDADPALPVHEHDVCARRQRRRLQRP